ncbi:Tn3 family transposase [Micromonospora sp. NPDC050695]|uniref:Tn3 family transposase n=1 Tax=Micromonospora sp. NPDC050695 TaxID=3154938 RepID=UPI0034052AEB
MAATVAAVLVLGSAQAGWAAPSNASAASSAQRTVSAPGSDRSDSTTVTLLTGDQVTLVSGGDDGIAVNPGKGQVSHRTHLSRYVARGQGVCTYTHVSDQHSTFDMKVIVATAPESHYVLDGLLGNATDLPVFEHATDTHGATLANVALLDLVGKQLSPRIRDLGKITLYRPDPTRTPAPPHPPRIPIPTGFLLRSRQCVQLPETQATVAATQGWQPPFSNSRSFRIRAWMRCAVAATLSCRRQFRTRSRAVRPATRAARRRRRGTKSGPKVPAYPAYPDGSGGPAGPRLACGRPQYGRRPPCTCG